VGKTFFTKNEENLRAKHHEGTPKEWGPRQVPRSPPLKMQQQLCSISQARKNAVYL